MNLVLVDVDHVRRSELSGDTFYSDLQLAFGKQREVIELVRVTKLDVASTLEVHHAREEVCNAADVNAWCAHITVLGIAD